MNSEIFLGPFQLNWTEFVPSLRNTSHLWFVNTIHALHILSYLSKHRPLHNLQVFLLTSLLLSYWPIIFQNYSIVNLSSRIIIIDIEQKHPYSTWKLLF